MLGTLRSKDADDNEKVKKTQGRSQYEANRGTRLGKILPNTVDFYFFIRLIILEDFIRLISYNGPCVRLGCSFFLATALKTIGLISKTTTSHVHHTFLYISFSFLHDYDVKMSNFAFYGGRKQATTSPSRSWILKSLVERAKRERT